jgi:hypothetical protein
MEEMVAPLLPFFFIFTGFKLKISVNQTNKMEMKNR